MQKDKYNNNRKKQKVERQKKQQKLDNKSEKKIILYCKFSFFLNFKQLHFISNSSFRKSIIIFIVCSV